MTLNNIHLKQDESIVDPDPVRGIKCFKNSQIVRIHFGQRLKIGQALLTIDFDGKLNDDLSGFYKTKCLNRLNQIEYAAVTQFEVDFFLDSRKIFI